MTAMASRRIYLQKCLEQAPRILSGIDRNPFSPTFGCCDWRYWHDKVADIPSGHDQEMVYFLALLYDTEDSKNPYYGSAWLLRLIGGVLDFWADKVAQRPALDEFYVREAQYGATAIVACAVAETLLLLGDRLPEDCRDRAREALRLSGRWLVANDEKTALANHQAQAALAVRLAADCCDDDALRWGYARKEARMASLFHADGWSQEYGYFDPGYQTTCLAFVDRLARHSSSERLRAFVRASHRTLQYVCLPSHQFGGETGSRKTRQIWPSSFERAARECPVAAALAWHFRDGLQRGVVHAPADQDRYAVQQLYDFMVCFRVAPEEIRERASLPFEGAPFVHVCESAGVVALKTAEGHHLVMNRKKGGTFHFCTQREGGADLSQLSDSGIAVRLADGTVLTSDWNGDDFCAEIDTDHPTEITVEGTLSQARFILPTPVRYLAFRVFMMLFGRSDFLRIRFRTMIARLLISERPGSAWRFRRKIELNGSLTVTDRIIAPPRVDTREAQVLVGQDASSIYVPISKAFDPTRDMGHSAPGELTGQETVVTRRYLLVR